MRLDDPHQIRNRPGQAIEFGDNKDVALPHELESGLELGADRGRRYLFAKNLLAANGCKFIQLAFEAGDLVDRGCSRVANDHGPITRFCKVAIASLS
jgi:hypothetical protein